MHPKNLSIQEFIYPLPEEKIAFHPLPKRDESKLLIYKNGEITDDSYKNIDNYIPEGALMIFNNTKVVEARLLFQKTTGGVIEIFCLHPHEAYADITTAMNERKSVKWLCLIGGASKWKKGLVLEKHIITAEKNIILQANYLEKRDDCFAVELKWNEDISFAEILHYAGKIPLPPYIKRAPEKEDFERYQTTYARYDGSVAAPTAGLHFTKSILEKLSQKNVLIDFVTLHVGAGTFKPVKAEKMEDHDMHAEYIEVNRSFIENLLACLHKPIIAAGTTSLRTIESLYWLGCKLLKDDKAFNHEVPFLSQWECYDLVNEQTNVKEALYRLLIYLKEKQANRLIAKTQIIIAPGYTFKIIKGLATNFHQPASTLLLLVAAFIGNDWRKVYDYALHNGFRFLSYGDGSLLWKMEY